MDQESRAFFLVRWFRRGVLGRREEIPPEEEERIQTPMRAMLSAFAHRKLAMGGLIVFLTIFAFVMVGPRFWPLDLSDQDSSLTNLPPSLSLMSLPKALLAGGVRDIASGNAYGMGIDQSGRLYTWGHTRITDRIDIADIPPEVADAELIHIAAGTDHAVGVSGEGEVFVWGNTRLQQDRFSSEMKKAMQTGGDSFNVVQLEAGNQFSAIVCADGSLYLWGNGNMADIKLRSQYQGQIAKVALTENEYISLLRDGSVAYTGYKDKNSPLALIPPSLAGRKVLDIAATGKSVAAVTQDGEIVVWGNAVRGEADVPALGARPVRLYGGRYHYTALLENGEIVCWGDDKYGQTQAPTAAQTAGNIENIFVSNYQNYALAQDGQVYTWGLRGFVLGTDSLGRDMLTRIVNGGKVTMTVGAVSVIIATLLGVLFGGIAGYFGGRLDLLIMRMAEIVGGLPFIPFAMILSAVIGSRLDPTQRMYLIMVVLGVLSWVPTCRLVRAQILAQREMEYVTAAKAMGIREHIIVFRHILPNVVSLLIVSMTLDFATCMLTESTLSYLGFGIPLPTPTWGNLLNGANNSIVIQQYWWQWVYPAAIFGVCTICINLIGDGLRDALDPKALER